MLTLKDAEGVKVSLWTLVSSISNFFSNKISHANKWMRKKIPTCSNLAETDNQPFQFFCFFFTFQQTLLYFQKKMLYIYNVFIIIRKQPAPKRELKEDDVTRHLVFAFNGFLDRQGKKEPVDEEKVKTYFFL